MKFSKDKEEMKNLIGLYNSYCQKVYVIDQLYKTNNSKMISDLIYIHIKKWIDEISDISNENVQSIERLKGYKELIQMFIDKIDSYALTNKIKLDIENEKKRHWGVTFGSEIDKINKPFSIINMFKKMFSGYSKLQNEYYLKKLQDYNNYQGEKNDSFCEMIYENLNCLRENLYDNIENTIDQILIVIKEINMGVHSPFEKNKPNTPLYTYFELSENKIKPSENTMIKFCKKLIQDYEYPKNKIIDFLISYIKNRFKLLNNGTFQQMISKNSQLQINMFKSYNILFENWIKTEGPKLSEEYSNIMKNLFIINKSYIHHSNDLNPDHDYVSMTNIILEIPMYLYCLINENSKKDGQLLTEIIYEEKDYLVDESTNEIYEMDGTKIGLWDDNKGIILM